MTDEWGEPYLIESHEMYSSLVEAWCVAVRAELMRRFVLGEDLTFENTKALSSAIMKQVTHDANP